MIDLQGNVCEIAITGILQNLITHKRSAAIQAISANVEVNPHI